MTERQYDSSAKCPFCNGTGKRLIGEEALKAYAETFIEQHEEQGCGCNAEPMNEIYK